MTTSRPQPALFHTPKPKPFHRLSDDEWLLIIQHFFNGSIILDLNNPTACKAATVLFHITRASRARAQRLIYQHGHFTAGIEILCPVGSLQEQRLQAHGVSFIPHLTLRSETIRFIRHLTIPGRLVHAFCRNEYAAVSNAKYLEALEWLVVEFEAGDWDHRVEMYGHKDWTPVELVARQMYFNFYSKPDLLRWFCSDQTYHIKFRFRFPIDQDVYHGASITAEGGVEIDEIVHVTGTKRTVISLWEDALKLAHMSATRRRRRSRGQPARCQ